MKLVSVIIPCFNDGLYIDEAINSVLVQTYPNIEIIVCDDGSKDKLTKEKLKNWEKKGIKILYQQNKGPSAARNTAIAESHGEYILPLDADDKIDKNYISEAVKVLDSDEDIGIVYCQASFFGRKTGSWELPVFSMGRMLVGNIIFVSGMFRKKDWVSVEGYCEELKHGIEDYDFWLSILSLGRKVVQLPQNLFFYRIKKQSRNKEFSTDINIEAATYQKIYKRHKSLYLKYIDSFYYFSRLTMLQQDKKISKILNFGGISEKLDSFPQFKRAIKKILGM